MDVYMCSRSAPRPRRRRYANPGCGLPQILRRACPGWVTRVDTWPKRASARASRPRRVNNVCPHACWSSLARPPQLTALPPSGEARPFAKGCSARGRGIRTATRSIRRARPPRAPTCHPHRWTGTRPHSRRAGWTVRQPRERTGVCPVTQVAPSSNEARKRGPCVSTNCSM